MKPQSIKLFDYFYLGAMFLGLLGFISGYNTFAAQLEQQNAASGVAVSPTVLIGGYVLGALIGLLLWFLVSHKRVILAKWVIVAFFLFSLIGVGDYFSGALPLHEIYGLLALIGQAVAVGMLFRGDAIRWLNDKGDEPGTTTGEPPHDSF